MRTFAGDGGGASVMCRSAVRREIAAGSIAGVQPLLKRSSAVEVSFCMVQKTKPSFALTAFFAAADRILRRHFVATVA